MSRADDLLSSVQKAVGDGPLQLLVGVGDLVSEKLRELPDAVTAWQEENRDFPMRAAGALIGSAFRANLKVGELYDDLTRRGQDVMTKMRGDEVFAEEDEPFVHEPFMPETVRRVGASTTSARTPRNAASKRAASTKAASKNTGASKKTVASKKTAPDKHHEAAMTSAASKATGAKSAKKPAKTAATKKTSAKKASAKKAAAKAGGKTTTSV